MNHFRKKVLSILFLSLLIIPAVSCADAGRIFWENSRAVVVVVAYNEKGEALGQGSGFIVRADGVIVTTGNVISNARSINGRTTILYGIL